LFERRLGSRLPGAFSSTPVCVSAMPERAQKLNGPPAKFGLS
jgi:hypothetical protein